MSEVTALCVGLGKALVTVSSGAPVIGTRGTSMTASGTTEIFAGEDPSREQARAASTPAEINQPDFLILHPASFGKILHHFFLLGRQGVRH